MDKAYSEALDKSLTSLVNTLPSILDMVLVRMNTDFHPYQQEVIRAEKTSVMKVVKFVGTLKSMPDDVFMKFLAVMDALKYGHVADEIRSSAGIPIPPRTTSTASLGTASELIHMEGDIFDQKPGMQHITAINDFIAAHWMDIGYSLNFDEDGNQVDLIAAQGQNNPKTCCKLVLQKWLKGAVGVQPVSWKTLLEIVLGLGHKSAHDKIKDYLVRELRKSPRAMHKLTEPVSATPDSFQSSGLPSMASIGSSYVGGSSSVVSDEADGHGCVNYDDGQD